MQEVEFQGKKDGALEFALSGEIDFAKAEAFYDAVASEYGQSPADIRFDCAALEFIDSTTLGTFVKILKKAKTDGFSLRLVGLQPKIKKLFVICALDKIIDVA